MGRLWVLEKVGRLPEEPVFACLMKKGMSPQRRGQKEVAPVNRGVHVGPDGVQRRQTWHGIEMIRKQFHTSTLKTYWGGEKQNQKGSKTKHQPFWTPSKCWNTCAQPSIPWQQPACKGSWMLGHFTPEETKAQDWGSYPRSDVWKWGRTQSLQT